MPTFTILPGTLNVKVKRGDTFSVTLDFTNVLSGYIIAAEVYSTTDGSTVQAMSVDGALAADGQVTVSLTATQTAGIPDGTYRWKFTWQTGSTVRTAVDGIFEVMP
jgi:hypothetical protein